MSAGRVSLTALRAFESLARTGTLRRAARELGVTASAVSQQVSALERQLGVVLLEPASGPRDAAADRITAEGRRFGRALRRAFRSIAVATDRLATMTERVNL
jgi:molybdate transport repressor ModE-like protein